MRAGDELSATEAVNVKDPVSRGVPASAPPAESVNPAGNEPLEIDQLYAGVPPLAASVWEYTMPAAPVGSGDDVVMVSGTATEIDSAFCAVCCGVLLSATRMVKFATPAAVGVPLIVDPVNASPAGSDPLKIDQLYGDVPPVAAKACE